jgi:hypothetical protein
MAAPVSIVIAEVGSDWTPWAAGLRRGAGKSCVLLQDEGETPRCFAARVRARLLALDLATELGDAVLAGGPGAPREVLEARASIVRFLRARRPERLVVLDARGSSRRAMEALRLSFDELGAPRAVVCAEPAVNDVVPPASEQPAAA